MGIIFTQKNDALEYLRDRGYKISHGKFSQDSNALVGSDGNISKEALSEYEKTLKKLVTKQIDDDFASMRQEGDARKSIAAAEREEIRLEAERRELDGKWMLREEAEQSICIWTALTRDYIAARLEKSATRIIAEVGGDLNRLPDLRAVFDEIITDACNDVANSGELRVEIRS